MEREIGEVWRVERPYISRHNWYVQFPKGIKSFTTKKEAKVWATVLKENRKNKEVNNER